MTGKRERGIQKDGTTGEVYSKVVV